MDYVWRKLRSESVLRTPHYEVHRDRLLHPHGHEVDYYVIAPHRFGTGIVALDEQGRILMVQQWRHPVQQLLWAIPAGGIEGQETPEQAVRRELREETGYEAADVRPLYRYFPNVGTSNQTFHLFVGRGLTQAGQTLPGEIHATRWFTWTEVEELIRQNDLVDGMTITALLLWERARTLPGR